MEDFITYELAVKLKEKGYKQGYNVFGYKPVFSDETTIRFISDIGAYENEYFGENIAAPTISQVLKWLREEKKYHIEFVGNACGYLFIISDVPSEGGTDRYCSDYSGPNDGGTWDKYEDCAIASIEYILDNLI